MNSPIIFRVDANRRLGMGHLMRCLALAQFFKEQGHACHFYSHDLGGQLVDLIQKRGHGFTRLKELHEVPEADAPWLVVDHYHLDEPWETEANRRFPHLLVIDDLANRPHQCQLLVDQNYFEEFEKRYDPWIPPETQRFLGPRYAIIHPRYLALTGRRERGSAKADHFFASFGGADANGQTEKAIRALKRLELPSLEFTVMVGGLNERRERVLEEVGGDPRFVIPSPTYDLSEIFERVDMALIAGGSTTWELCYLGIPVLSMSCADNQKKFSEDFSTTGAIDYLGWWEDVSEDLLHERLLHLLETPSHREELSIAARDQVDGKGVMRIHQAMTSQGEE